MRRTKLHIARLVKFTFIVLLPFQIGFVNWAVEHPEWVEQQYSLGFYPKMQTHLSGVSSVTAIPIGQIVFYTLLTLLVVWVVQQCRKLWLRRISVWRFLWVLVKNGLFAFSLFYGLFNLTWGLNYHRLKIPEIAQLATEDITKEELTQISDTLARRCNELRSGIVVAEELPIFDDEILSQAMKGFQLASGHYAFIQYEQPSVKAVLVPRIMSSFRIGGIYFMFTGEANVNMDAPNFLVPATTCHEMAHQAGFASEDEANFISYLATQFHPDPNFQYSGNLMAFRYTMRSLYRVDSVAYQDIADRLSAEVKSDLRKHREYWSSFDNPIDPLTDAMYDLFLKANDQEAGIQSYSQVTSLLVGEYRRSGLNFVD